MAGLSSSIDTAAIRTLLRQTMLIGAPPNPADGVTFRWSTQQTAAGPTDPTGVPYDFTSTPASVVTQPDVQVPCSVRYTAGQYAETPLGDFDTTRPVLTLMDVDYLAVQGADKVLIGGQVYSIAYVAPPEGLYDLTVWTIYLEADSTSDHKLTRS